MDNRSPELQVLLDKQATTELLTRCLRSIDRADIATLRACYLEGATEEHGGMYAGPAQGYIDSIERLLSHPKAVATHTLSNILIDLDGDRAVSEHYVLATTRVKIDVSVSDSLVATRIIDDLERRDGRWGIARRRLRFDWSHDVGEREERWIGETLDPAALLHSSKYPDAPVYDGIMQCSEMSQ